MPVALVTGGNSGIGRASAVALARDGFDVGITWHSGRDKANEVVAEIEHEGRHCATRELDLHSAEDAQRVVGELADELGGIHALINNAGHGATNPFLELELSEWRSVVDVDLTGAFAAGQAAARRMVAQGGGGS